jgi:nucleoside-diphosphate-sugar epimerase
VRIVVSGASGRLAAALVPKLCANPDVTEVIGVDRVPPPFGHPKLASISADIRDPSARSILRGAASLVHLAFVLQRGRLRLQEMRDNNVEGSETFLAAAAAKGVERIVHLSTAAVYGSGSDLTEDAPLAPWPRFHYACQKAELDTWIARNLPRAVVLRPTAILGPNLQPLLRQLFAIPFYVRLPDPQPRLQCVHEDDVADAIVAALAMPVRGAFNLAAPQSFAVRELVRWRRPRALGLPLVLVRGGLELAWRATGWGGETGWLDGITASLTLDCRRAAATLSWQPRHTNWREIVAASHVAAAY